MYNVCIKHTKCITSRVHKTRVSCRRTSTIPTTTTMAPPTMRTKARLATPTILTPWLNARLATPTMMRKTWPTCWPSCCSRELMQSLMHSYYMLCTLMQLSSYALFALCMSCSFYAFLGVLVAIRSYVFSRLMQSYAASLLYGHLIMHLR